MAFESLMKYAERGNITYFPSFLLSIIFIIISWNLCLNFVKWISRRKTLPPGPIGLPIVGYLPFLGSKPHKTLWKMKEKYGDIIGISFGPSYTVVLNEYSVAKEVTNNLAALDRPSDLYNHVALGFAMSNGQKWTEQRRFSLSVSRDLGLGRSAWESLVMEEVQSFGDEIKRSGGNPLDICEVLDHSIKSNIISLLIGRKLHKIEDANKIQLSLDFTDIALSNTGISQATTVMPSLRKLFKFFNIGGHRQAAKIIKDFQEFIKEEIQLHKRSQEVNDFMSSYLNKLKMLSNSKTDAKHYFSERMLQGNVTDLFLGASDTTKSSLSYLFRLMADHKSVQDKVYQELIDVVGKEGIVKFEERHKIPYTFAALMEAQRFSSIIPLSTTRVATQDIPVGKYIIPKGAHISINLWGLHHDPRYWNDPDKFIPERFLTDGGTKLIKQPPSYAAFSLGKRNCPGETVAWMEILAYFTHVVRNYEIRFPPGVKPDYNILPALVERLVPQPLCFKERS